MTKNKQFDEIPSAWIIPGIAVLMVALISWAVVYAVRNPGQGGRADGISAATQTLAVGSQAPQFTLSSVKGAGVSLSQYAGKPVLLYFSEGVGCQVCWQQIISVDADPDFAATGVPMVAIAPDSASSWAPIVQNNPIKSPILVDGDLSVSRRYGMLEMGSTMHKGVRPGHTFVMLDGGGKVLWIGDYPTMSLSAVDLAGIVRQKLAK